MDYEKIKTVEDRDRFNYVIEQFGDLWIEYSTGIK